jgi:adenylate cyclase
MTRAPGARERLVGGLAAGVVAAAIALAAGATDAFRTLEARTGDLRLRAEARLGAGRPDSSIVIVDIDDESLRAFRESLGRWPWRRDAHAAILEVIALGRPRAVAYDVLFAERDLAHPGADAALAAATAEAGAPVIHAVVFERRLEEPAEPTAPDSPDFLAAFALPFVVPPRLAPAYREAAPPVRELLGGAAGIGAIDRAPDPDGVERLEPLLARHRARTYPALALAAAAGGRAGYDRLAVRHDELHFDGAAVPFEAGRLRAHWRGAYADRPYPVVPAHAVLRAYSAIATGREPPIDSEVFAGRVVLVGSSAAGVGDILASPFGPAEPGVLLHATLLDTLVSKAFLRAPTPLVAAVVTALVALLAGLGVAAARSVRNGAIALAGVLLGWTAVAAAAFFAAGWILPWAGPALAAIVAYGAASAGSWLTEGRRHREIKRAFGKFLPPDVVETIAADPMLQRRVDRRELTILFADVRGFTTLSERHGAERIVETLNELFAEMVEAIFQHHGTLDKFLGDGLMAFFGAPLPQPDHAACACRAAREMLARLERLNERWTAAGRPRLEIGIGIHSGEAVVGFVGDVERRLEYTAIGDAVNLASRLQDLTKELDAPVLVSEETARRAGSSFATRPLGARRIRGREEAVDVFALETAEGGG